MNPITYKFVMDEKGLLSGVELWQNNQYITVSMSIPDVHKNGYRWSEVKDFLDNVQAPKVSSQNSIDDVMRGIVLDA